MLENKELEKLTEILGSLFLKYRADDDVLKLSEWVDRIVVRTQKERQEIYDNTRDLK